MRLHDIWLVVRTAVLLCLPQLLHQSHTLLLDAARQAPARTRMHKFQQLLWRKVEQVVEVNATVRKLAEGALLLKL